MKGNAPRPPRLGEWLLRRGLSSDGLTERLGDFEELYRRRAKRGGRLPASIWYCFQVVRLMRSRRNLSFYWRFAMLKNDLLIAIRSFARHKGYSLLNLFGLALGMTSFLLIAIWIFNEFSYDRFHVDADRIHRVMEELRFPDQSRYSELTPGLLAAALEEAYPEVEIAVRTAWTGERVVRRSDKAFYESQIATVDPAFFEVFSFPLIKGDPGSALENLQSIVISESTAEKYFGGEDPLGQILSLDNRFDLTVTGVMADIPDNSHLRLDMAVPFEMVERLGWKTDAWDFSMARTYLRLEPNVDARRFAERIADLVKRNDADSNIELFLQPIARIHLHSDFENPGGGGRILYVYVFGFVGILILGMACINFMNLTTARSEHRAREIGLRKVVGAARRQLIRQFLVEAVVMAFAALLCVPLLIQALLPLFNRLTEGSFSPGDFLNVPILLLVIGITLGTGLVAGSYPALVLSSFQPVQVLQNRFRSGLGAARFRRLLVVTQVAVSLVLIIVSFVVYSQIEYLRNKDLGFEKRHVLSIPLGISNADNPSIYQRFRAEVEQHPFVESISAAFTHPTWFGTRANQVVYNGKRLDEDSAIYLTSVDFDFIETLQIQMLEGRGFSREFGAERGNLIVNRRFEQLLGGESALNKTLALGEDYRGEIVGVMRDFHIESVTESLIGPLILFCNPGINYIYVRLRPGSMDEPLSALETAWKRAAPHLPFRFNFLDEEFDRFFRDVERIGIVIRAFTILAGVIACLGLLGLASFAAGKRTKEIGVRKVLGSSVIGLIRLLCRDFVRLVLFANLVAWPVSWYAMSRWLQSFPYRVELEWGIFAISGLLTLGVALLTVSLMTVRAALSDPVKALRYE